MSLFLKEVQWIICGSGFGPVVYTVSSGKHCGAGRELLVKKKKIKKKGTTWPLLVRGESAVILHTGHKMDYEPHHKQ